MFIREIHIEGFGIFCDHHVALSPGLNIICGPNEAGKSTFLAFIQHVIFGFPDGRSKERKYEALRGGRLGGRLVLENRQGERYVIERFAGIRGGNLIVRLPDGSAGSESTLQNLLGNTSRDVFCKIFAFGLDQLQQMNTLQDDGVRAHIYSAGTGGISIAGIEEQLSKKADALFRPNAQKSTINQLLKDLENQNQELRTFGQESQTYDGLVGQREQLVRSIETEDLKVRALAEKIGDLKRYRDAWEPWRKRVEIEKELETLDIIENFPEDGTSELARIEDKIQTFRDNIQESRDRIDDIHQTLENLSIDDAILQCETDIGALSSDRNTHESQCKEWITSQAKLQQIEEEFTDTLRSLGDGWTEDRITSFDDSIPVQEEIRQFKAALEMADGAHLEKQRQSAEAEKQLREIRATCEDLHKNAKDNDDISEAEYEERRTALRKLVQWHSRYLAFREGDEPAATSGASLLPNWPIYAMLTLAVFTGAGLGLFIDVVAGLVTGILVGVMAIGYALVRNRPNPSQMPIPGTSKKQNERDINELGGIFGLRGIPSQEDLDRIDKELEKNRERLSDKKNKEARIGEIEAEIKRKLQVTEDLKRELHEAVENRKQKQNAWEGWVTERGLPRTLLPEGALALFNEIKTARRILKNVCADRKRIRALSESVETYETKARTIAQTCRQQTEAFQSAISLADHLIRELEKNRENARLSHHLQEDLHEVEQKQQRFQEQLDDQEIARKKLFDLAGAEDSEAFRQKFQTYQKRQSLISQRQQYRQELERFLGVAEKYHQAIQTLQNTSLIVLQEEIDTLEKALKSEQQMLDIKREELGGLRQSIADLEAQDRAAELRLAHHANRAKLNAQTEEWATWTLARALLVEARSFYEKERRPGVIKEAEGFFSLMTHACYTQVRAPLDGSEIQVEDQNGSLRTAEVLSRGTAEQLYLALRMGLIREFARKAEALPVITDDIMVNFDPERAVQAVRAFHQLSQDHQIIVFTCHPTTRALFENGISGEEINVIELDRQAAFSGWVKQSRESSPEIESPSDTINETDGLAEYLLDKLEEGGRGITELEAELKVDKTILRPVLEKLRDSGQVNLVGHGRGAKWVLQE